MHPGALAERYELEHLRGKPLSDRAGYVSGGASWDPGGTSYGPYQLSLKAGNVDSYMKSSAYADQFKGLKPGSKDFNNQWKATAKAHPQEFIDDQYKFIEKEWFGNAMGNAKKNNIPVDNPVVQNAVFSISNQHGGYRKIFSRAGVKEGDSPQVALDKLYGARGDYIQGLKGKQIQKLKPALMRKRVTNELRDAQHMLKTGSWE